jgi:hypothetical protein
MTKLAMVIALSTLAACGPVDGTSFDRGVAKRPAAGADSDPGTDTGSGTNAGDSRPDGRPDGTDPSSPDAAPAPEPGATAIACTRDAAFPAVFPIAEASGAVEVSMGGAPRLLVAADSKNQGSALLVPLPGGGATRAVVLPIDPQVSDDLEGLATAAGAVYALTSSGAVMRFLPNGLGFTRDGAAYRIGAAPLSCDKLTSTNCGKNWEGLCLRRKPPAAGECAGYAASKAEGALYCVKLAGTTLAIDPAVKPIALAVPAMSLSDCAFGASALVVTTNDKNGSKSYVVDETSGKLAPLPVGGLGSNEAIQVGSDGALYQLEDSSSATSAASRYVCKGL